MKKFTKSTKENLKKTLNAPVAKKNLQKVISRQVQKALTGL